MKFSEIKNKNTGELSDLLIKERMKIAQFRFDQADKKVKRTSDIRETRRTIARILTLLKASK
jgi:ribosomal protein L29